ncbi:hypothetical protein GCM10008956_32850 [Deinococcus arenae]|uniref:Knr4/Smi1-like domain-containing protein n=1 Tax=Deinococcus arenae TaxID=1452751 RepID=A0A8H9GRZ3_9DEIO|nr:SMI1/KNR4 family protein [Deinococcus arenae]GGM54376.1 hypothetical protein GCM10008956_32850 [Deinococcus arenae]
MSVSAFVDVLTARLPTLAAPLRGPVSAADLQLLQAAVEVPLPPEIQDLYATVDGQDGILPGALLGLTWLPARRAAQEHATWMDLAQDDPALVSEPAGAIQAVTFHHHWVPLAVDGSGNGLAVDLAPGPMGMAGQVITYGPDETTRRVVSPSVTALFHWAATAVAQRDVQVSGDEVTYRGHVSFLDALREMTLPLR